MVNGALVLVRRSCVVVISSHSEAACSAEGIGKRIDGAGQAHSNGQHHGVPVSPPYSAEDATIFDFAVSNRKS